MNFTADLTAVSLWLAVIASGLYHGLNPAMGWPFAVSAGLAGRGWRDTAVALGPLCCGHLLALGAFLLPFALIASLVQWQWEIRICAGLALVGFGLWRGCARQRPNLVNAIRPAQITWWSFVVALAHGAGLMLAPLYLGLCTAESLDAGHRATAQLIAGRLSMALVVAVAHTAAMVAAGGLLALLVQRWCGVTIALQRWFNRDVIWAMSLFAVGVVALTTAWIEKI